ncbi:MAG: hypothetical protein WCE54_01945 [Ignavibacteriaceae bacterium]
MEGNKIQQREELLEACHDLRLPVAGNENLKTLELYIQAAYDDFEVKDNYENHQTNLASEEEFDYGSIGDKSWRLKYLLNKILFFL